MSSANASWVVVLWAAVLASCSVLIDTDKQQCDKAKDCGTFAGEPIYACEQGFCATVACDGDTSCRERGDFVCEAETCVPALCSGDDQCTVEGRTCVEGRCIDPIFYCFDREAALMSKDEPVLKFTVVGYGDSKALSSLDVKVCAIADPLCSTPIPATTSYDEDGELTIRGLENGRRYSIRLSGVGASGLRFFEAEYFMQRPVLGLTVESDRFELVPDLLIGALADGAGVKWNPATGLVIAEVFGCDNRPLKGVSFTDNRSSSVFYLTGTPSVNATETDALGVGGFVNMEVGEQGGPVQHKLTFTYGARTLFSFPVTPRPHVLTFLNLYMQDYGSTTDRNSQLTGGE